MNHFRTFKLAIDNPLKEYFLLNQLCEDCFSSGSRFDHASKKKHIIYVASSANKIRRLRKQLRKSQCAPPSPTFVTIKQLFRYLYEFLPAEQRPQKRFITESHAGVILRYILIEKRSLLFPSPEFSLSAETADFFVKWIRNIKEYDLNIAFSKGTIRYRENGLSFDITTREHRYNEHLLQSLASVFNLYQEFLAQNGLADESDRKWWIIDHLKEAMVKNLSFYIEHLSILRTVEQSLFRLIYQYAKSVSLLDFSYPFTQKQFTTTGIVSKPCTPIAVPNNKAGIQGVVSLHGFQKREHEIEDLARRISSLEYGQDIAIIAPNVDEYEPIIERVFPRYSIHPPFSTRKKLSEYPIIKTCLSIFDIITVNFGRKAVVSFLLSPFISFLTEEERSIVDKTTRRAMIASGDDWQRLSKEKSVLGHISKFISDLLSLRNKRGLEFLSHYILFLEKMVIREGDEHIKPMNMLMNYLSMLIREPLVSTIGAFGLTDFQRILTSYAETAGISEEKPFDERVSLFNIEESSSMNFETAFLIGLVEGNSPQSPQYNPLFSEKLLAEMGFPTFDLVYDLSKYNFQSIIQSAQHICCSFYEKDEQGNVYLSSPFLRGIEAKTGETVTQGIRTFHDWQISAGEMVHAGIRVQDELMQGDLLHSSSLIREGIERFRDEKRLRNVNELISESPELTPYVKRRISALSQNLSPFALELYQQCPYSYFLHYIVGLRESEEPEQGVDRMIRGLVIHAILARFLERKLSKHVGKYTNSEWKILQSIALTSIREMAPRARDRILLNLELASDEYESLLQKYLRFETSMHKRHRLEDVEWDFTGKEVHLTCGDDTLGFRGRIDRIDRLPDGLVIFDYKTGSKKNLPSNHRIEHGTSLQLPLYALAVERCFGKVLKTAYFLISNTDGILVEERAVVSEEQLIDTIAHIWAHIKEMHFEPSPASDCATRCTFSALCPEISSPRRNEP